METPHTAQARQLTISHLDLELLPRLSSAAPPFSHRSSFPGSLLFFLPIPAEEFDKVLPSSQRDPRVGSPGLTINCISSAAPISRPSVINAQREEPKSKPPSYASFADGVTKWAHKIVESQLGFAASHGSIPYLCDFGAGGVENMAYKVTRISSSICECSIVWRGVTLRQVSRTMDP